MPQLIGPRTNTRIKNLRWLNEHSREVKRLYLYPFVEQYSDGFLVAHLTDDRVYVTTFASFAIAINWLQRSRSLKRVSVWSDTTGDKYPCGKCGMPKMHGENCRKCLQTAQAKSVRGELL